MPRFVLAITPILFATALTGCGLGVTGVVRTYIAAPNGTHTLSRVECRPIRELEITSTTNFIWDSRLGHIIVFNTRGGESILYQYHSVVLEPECFSLPVEASVISTGGAADVVLLNRFGGQSLLNVSATKVTHFLTPQQMAKSYMHQMPGYFATSTGSDVVAITAVGQTNIEVAPKKDFSWITEEAKADTECRIVPDDYTHYLVAYSESTSAFFLSKVCDEQLTVFQSHDLVAWRVVELGVNNEVLNAATTRFRPTRISTGAQGFVVVAHNSSTGRWVAISYEIDKLVVSEGNMARDIVAKTDQGLLALGIAPDGRKLHQYRSSEGKWIPVGSSIPANCMNLKVSVQDARSVFVLCTRRERNRPYARNSVLLYTIDAGSTWLER